MENKKRVKQSFAKGAIIMTIAMILVKVLGAAFKIPLTYIIGGEGMGYFHSAYHLYNPIYALASAGLPIAISRMVSGEMARHRFRDVRKIYKISVPVFITTGIIGFVVMTVSAFIYADYAKLPDSIYSMLMLAPTVLFSCFIAIYRGYFEGLHNMSPTAVSEILEAIGKVVFGLGLAYFTTIYGLNEFNAHGTVFGRLCENEIIAKNTVVPYAAAGAVLGISLGAVLGFIYLYITYKIKGDGITQKELDESPESLPAKAIFRSILNISIPIGLGAIIMNLGGVVDSFLISRRLHDLMQTVPEQLLRCYNGLIPSSVISRGNTHVFLLGCFGNMTTIIMFLPAIAQGLAISALPSMTAAWIKGVKEDIKSNIESILKITTVISIPGGLGLSALAHPVMDLVYNSFGNKTQASEAFIAAQIMIIAAIGVIFVSISTPILSMLQAVGRADLTVKILSIGIVFKVLLNYFLVGIPKVNIQGAGLGTLICYIFICGTAFWFLCKETKIKPNIVSIFIKPLICGIFSAVGAFTSHGLFSSQINYKLSTIFSIIVAIFVYIVSILLLKTFNSQDLYTVTKNKKLVKMLEKHNLL